MNYINNKERFLYIINSNVHRDGVENLIEWLCSSDFFNAPASTKYHDSVEGGLCKHSLEVYDRLLTKKTPEDSLESITIVSLLHDLCKVNFYKQEDKRVYKNGLWETVKGYVCEETFPLGHGEKSLFIVQRFINLTEDEALAIRWHMGPYNIISGSTDSIAYHQAIQRTPLLLKLFEADMESAFGVLY